MAELIKEVTPPKKPDLSNPYQTASPVKPSLQKKPAKKRRPAEGRPKEPEKKEVDLSQQTIIEATIPTVSVLYCLPYGILLNPHFIGEQTLSPTSEPWKGSSDENKWHVASGTAPAKCAA
jgi:hypothetical protein